MDPVSIVGLVSSALSAGKVIASLIKGLKSLRSKYTIASLMITSLIGQLSTIRAALKQVSDLIESCLQGNAEDEQLVDDLKISLECCHDLLSILNERVTKLDADGVDLNFFDKVKFLWDENEVGDVTGYLDRQISALQLLLTAIQCQNSFGRNKLLQRSESRHVFKKVEDDRSSIMILGSGESVSSARSVKFDLNDELKNPNMYRRAPKFHDTTINKDEIEIGAIDIAEKTPSPLHYMNLASRRISKSSLKEMGRKFLSFKTLYQNQNLGHSSAIASPNSPSIQSTNTILETHQEPDRLPSIPETDSNNTIPTKTSTSTDNLTVVSSSTSSLIDDTTMGSNRSSSESVLAKQRSFDHIITSSILHQQITSDSRNAHSVILVGCPNSGQSTLKKSINMFGREMTIEEIRAYRKAIRSCIVHCIHCVLDAMKTLNKVSVWAQTYGLYHVGDWPYNGWPYHYSPDKICSLITSSWEDRGFREAFEAWSCDLAAKETARYYFRSIHRIWTPDYMPTKEDILRPFAISECMTISIMIGDQSIRIHDTGEKIGRQGWINIELAYRPATIIHTISMSNFNKPMKEYPYLPQLIQDLRLFEIVCEAHYDSMPRYILLFDKLDELMTNLRTSICRKEFRKFFPGFSGNFENIQHIQDSFRLRFDEVAQGTDGEEILVNVLFGELLDPNGTTTKTVFDILYDHSMKRIKVE